MVTGDAFAEPGIETHRSFVYPTEMDHNGHMNVQFYVRHFDEASWHLLGSLGLGPGRMREMNRGFAAVEQTVRYQKEVLQGTLIVVRSRVLEVSRKTVRYFHTMFDAETAETMAEAELVVVCLDMETRHAVDLPEVSTRG